MSVNGITSTQAAYTYSAAANTAKESTAAETTAQTSTKKEESGVIYEPSKEDKIDSSKKTYKPDTNLINKLKSDADARTQQLQSMVDQLLSQQSTKYGQANDIWKLLASGKFTVDPATKAQAQADIAEDGYWGVEKTSDRIIEFANALTGGDPSKIEDMRAAFQKGFKMAEKKWGGSLPDISQRTYDAVMQKFDKQAEDAGLKTKTVEE